MTTSRVDPTGNMLENGFSTKIAFAADANVTFWEKSVTPPGVDGGDAIEISTMFNTTWRTKAAQSLKDLTDAGASAAWDPKVYDEIVALINVEGEITITFPDDSTLDFFGYLKSFVPGEMAEGDQPMADIVVVCTNINPNTLLESGPVFTDNSGT